METVSPLQRSSRLLWLRRELAPFPGRAIMTLRMVISSVAVVIISMALQTPSTAVSAYLVFFVCKENHKVTAVTAIGITVGATIGIALSIFLYRYTFGYPVLRIPVMALAVFGGMFLNRVLVLGPLAFAIGFVLAVTQNVADSVADANKLVRELLWLWVVLVLPAAVTVIVSRIMLPAELLKPAGGHSSNAASGATKKKKSLFVRDAFANPNHVRFALKVTLAAMSCYIIYCGLDWQGIHTAFITCIIIALESTEATMHKGQLRLAGCAVGGLLGFLAIMYLIPHMESITSLSLVTAAGAGLAGWVAAGSKRIAYAGLQIALAFFMCILQGFAPDTHFAPIRDRLVGIVLGIFATSFVFHYLWPEHEADTLGKPVQITQ